MTHITTTLRNRSQAVLAAGLAVAALLAACADKPSPSRTTTTGNDNATTPVALPASATLGAPSSLVGPAGIGGMPTATTPKGPLPASGPTLPEIPPTAAETKAAWQEGLASYDARDYETAGARLQIAAAGRPDDAYVQYLHGLALWKAGHLAEAEDALTRSSALEGGSIKTWINLARVRMARQDATGALQAADEALALDPVSADALHQRGRALAEGGRNDEALDALQQARAAGPDNGYIANTLGHLLLTMGRVDEAIPHLEAARDRLPEVAFVRNNLGVAYERHGDLDRAAEEYRAAVGAGDSDGKAAASLLRIEPLVGPRIAGDPEPPQETTGGEDSSS
jgi:Flp pilus assembly protein TadD